MNFVIADAVGYAKVPGRIPFLPCCATPAGIFRYIAIVTVYSQALGFLTSLLGLSLGALYWGSLAPSSCSCFLAPFPRNFILVRYSGIMCLALWVFQRRTRMRPGSAQWDRRAKPALQPSLETEGKLQNQYEVARLKNCLTTGCWEAVPPPKTERFASPSTGQERSCGAALHWNRPLSRCCPATVTGRQRVCSCTSLGLRQKSFWLHLSAGRPLLPVT